MFLLKTNNYHSKRRKLITAKRMSKAMLILFDIPTLFFYYSIVLFLIYSYFILNFFLLYSYSATILAGASYVTPNVSTVAEEITGGLTGLSHSKACLIYSSGFVT